MILNSIFLPKEFSNSSNLPYDQWFPVRRALEDLKVQSDFSEDSPNLTSNEPGSVSKVLSIENAWGFMSKNISFEGDVHSINGYPGVILSKNTTLRIKETPLFYEFKTPESLKTNPGYTESTVYSESHENISFNSLQKVSKERVYSPTFYFRFYIASDSTFPFVFFMKGDITSPNSFGIVFKQNLESDTSKFFLEVFVHTEGGEIVQYSPNFAFNLDQLHSFSLTLFSFFGEQLQFTLSFDDGINSESSSVIPAIIQNTSSETIFFPKKESIWNVFGINNESSVAFDERGPSIGSLLLHFSQLNSGSGILSNSVFSDNLLFMGNCLSSCPLNFAFNPLYQISSTSDSSRRIPANEKYQSSLCLNCSSVFPLFNAMLLPSSLSTLTMADFDYQNQPKKSN